MFQEQSEAGFALLHPPHSPHWLWDGEGCGVKTRRGSHGAPAALPRDPPLRRSAAGSPQGAGQREGSPKGLLDRQTWREVSGGPVPETHGPDRGPRASACKQQDLRESHGHCQSPEHPENLVKRTYIQDRSSCWPSWRGTKTVGMAVPVASLRSWLTHTYSAPALCQACSWGTEGRQELQVGGR